MSTSLTPAQILESRRLHRLAAASGIPIAINISNNTQISAPSNQGPAGVNGISNGSILYFNSQRGFNIVTGTLSLTPISIPDTNISYSGNVAQSILIATFTTPPGLLQTTLIDESLWDMNLYGVASIDNSIVYYYNVYYVSEDGSREIPIAIGSNANATYIQSSLYVYKNSLRVPRIVLPDLTYRIRIKVYLSFSTNNTTAVIDFSGRIPSFINTSIVSNRCIGPHPMEIPCVPHEACELIPSHELECACEPAAIHTPSISTIITHSILPAADNIYTIGAPGLQYKSIYIGTSSLTIGNVPLSATSAGNLVYTNPITRSTITVGGDKYLTSTIYKGYINPIVGENLTLLVSRGLSYIPGITVLVKDKDSPYDSFNAEVIAYDSVTGVLDLTNITSILGTFVEASIYTITLGGGIGPRGPTGPTNGFITFSVAHHYSVESSASASTATLSSLTFYNKPASFVFTHTGSNVTISNINVVQSNSYLLAPASVTCTYVGSGTTGSVLSNISASWNTNYSIINTKFVIGPGASTLTYPVGFTSSLGLVETPTTISNSVGPLRITLMHVNFTFTTLI